MLLSGKCEFAPGRDWLETALIVFGFGLFLHVAVTSEIVPSLKLPWLDDHIKKVRFSCHPLSPGAGIDEGRVETLKSAVLCVNSVFHMWCRTALSHRTWNSAGLLR